MEGIRKKQYPTILQSIHLVILYIFIQTIVDFPLALLDYYRDSDYLYNPVKKIVVGVGSVVFILWYGLKRTGNPLKTVFPLKKFHPILFLLLIFFFLGIQQLLNVINNIVEIALPPPEWFWDLFNKVFDSDFGFWGAFLKVVIIAPIIEELIFRGVIVHGLMRNYSRVTAILMSGLLFALFHLNPWQFPATFVLGIILGWLMIRTQNILLCISGHAVNNLLVLLSIGFQQQIKESYLATFSMKYILIICALLVVFSVALMYLATKEKVTAKDG